MWSQRAASASTGFATTGRRGFRRPVLAFPYLAVLLSALPISAAAQPIVSRVYVKAFTCAKEGEPQSPALRPKVVLFNEAFDESAESVARGEIDPAIRVVQITDDAVNFYFDVPPGNYYAGVHFPHSTKSGVCGRDGPLVVIPGKDRHLFIATCECISDWHSRAAVAGSLPFGNLSVSVLVYDHPMKCGDPIRQYDSTTLKPINVPRWSRAVIDGEAYYANFHAYGKQDKTIALEFGGDLFTRGAILVTESPDFRRGEPPFILKDITPQVLHAALAPASAEKLACVAGF